MAIGYTDLKEVIKFPATWDLSYLRQWQLKDGSTFDNVVARLGGALVMFNRSLTAGYWAQYLQTTTDLSTEYDIGGNSDELEMTSEYTRPDPIIGEATGHMLPMHDYGGALGWTYMALRRAHRNQLERGVRRLIERSENTWERKLLTRLFSSAAETVGATGVSVPFADGGTADPTYIPPSYKGKVFANTHSHFLRYTDDAAGRTAALKAMMAHLVEHGYRAPFELVIPETDMASWVAQTEFVKPERAAFLTAGVEKRAMVDEANYLGVVETDQGWARVKYETRLPADYAGMFKPAGFNSPMSPLVVRYESGYPLGLSLVAKIDNFPLQDAVAYFTFGVGVADRLAGTATYFAANGNYVDPTIS
jgi:hypothetical protein